MLSKRTIIGLIIGIAIIGIGAHAQSCNPMDCSLPGSSVHGLFQARILEWVAISFSNIFLTTFPEGLKFSK